MKTYKSEISWSLAVPLALILLGSLIMTIMGQNWPTILIMLLTCAFVFHLYASTSYRITENNLIVKSGFIVNINIPIGSIKSIKPSKSILSSPALSLDRIEVSYGKFDSVLISPKERSAFIAELKKINPEIDISLAA
ncbi:PH domain-containing protein [uncultured Arcticibacterium sp.]|uniref:PH domain-containing protein n=1 Tax=uncultured Arcticibacterium sp. TaxID=2173042 RepID=UPI0030F4EF4C